MRNMKKFLALVLAMVMVLSMAVITTSAADKADYTDAALQLNALKVMVGDENGNLMLDKGVTRYQTALFFARALTGTIDTAVWNSVKTSATFSDVTEYGTAIDYAYGVNVVRGRGNGVFGYNDPIIYQDMVVMAVRALGYETPDMAYPYGHILAAQKLELLEGIDNVNYKAEFTRGETAQLIWNMLNTEIAVVDPLTDKILYPGEEGLTTALTDKQIERTTLLVESEFASASIDAVIVAFEEADEDDEEDYDKLTIEYGVNSVEIKAADLGITADTAKVDYLGLPVTLYVDCAADEFATKYADEEAAIVFADGAEYIAVENLAGDANIKVTPVEGKNPSITVGGVKFTDDKYEFVLKTFGENGWEVVDAQTWNNAMASFVYTTKDGYIGDVEANPFNAVVEAANLNTYGKIEYRVVEDTDNNGKDEVEVLYTPYTFGQYVEREIKYNATAKVEKFVAIGTLADTTAKNIADEDSYVREALIGSNMNLTVNTKSVSKAKGEAANTVTVEGVEVKSGDFMFYNYNALDNVLTVAANCGTTTTGRMTATSASKETVKIGGTNLEFGFDGLYNAFTPYNNTTVKAYIADLEAGKDNVQYLAVNGKIVWMAACDSDSEAAEYSFAIVTLDSEVMAELLDTTVAKYEKALVGALTITEDDENTADVNEFVGFTNGLYVKDGYVLVAMLNTATGAWELAKVNEFALTYADQDATADEDWDFTNYVDLATVADYIKVTTQVNGAAEYVAAANALTSSNIFMVVDDEDGVYTLAATTEVDENGDAFIVGVENTTGLVFNTAGRTNLITADADVDAARISTADDTVIVAIGADLDDVQVRTGVQSDKKSINGTVTYLAADSKLIVLVADAGVLDATWGKGSAIALDANYYVVLPDTATEYGTTDDGDATLTITGLFDLKTNKVAEDIVVVADTAADLDDEEEAVAAKGNLVYVDEDGALTKSNKSIATAIAEILGEDAFVATVTEWADEESITVKKGNAVVTNAANAIAGITATVVTLDLTELDWAEDVDVDNLFVSKLAYDEENEYGLTELIVKDGLARYNYHVDLDDVVTEITEPTVGIFSNFEIAADAEGAAVYELVNIEENGVLVYDIEYSTAAIYDEDTQELALYIVKIVK